MRALASPYLDHEQGAHLLALVAAAAAGQANEVPVGAVLRHVAGWFLAECGNDTVSSVDPTGHAEVRVLRQGARRTRNHRLSDTLLTITLEPCGMCQAALAVARVAGVHYQAKRPWPEGVDTGFEANQDIDAPTKTTIKHSKNNDLRQKQSRHDTAFENEAGHLLRIFFAERRKICSNAPLVTWRDDRAV